MPNKWIGEHIAPMSQDVILRMGKGERIARYNYHNIRHPGGLTGGWKPQTKFCSCVYCGCWVGLFSLIY